MKVENAKARIASGPIRRYLARAVGAGVVDHYDFKAVFGVVERGHGSEGMVEYDGLIVRRNEQGYAWQFDGRRAQAGTVTSRLAAVNEPEHAKHELIDQHEPDDNDARYECCINQNRGHLLPPSWIDFEPV